MKRFFFQSKSEADTERLGVALANILPSGTTVSLCGTLGAGKTRLVQAIAKATGIADNVVVSPTFVLCQPYHGDRTIYHLDAYRIADDDEFLNLGPEEFFDSDGITIVEWGDRIANCLPEARIEIIVEVTGEDSRNFVIFACDASLDPAISQLIDTFPEKGDRTLF